MRRRRPAPHGPNDGYLISFGDTMTALLAFFIVLNSLASEQTGVNMYSGTGSFIRATDELGVPGIFKEKLSRNALQLQQPTPQYIVPAEGEPNFHGHGPDESDDTTLIRDWDVENFERAINELTRFHRSTSSRQSTREISLERLAPLAADNDLLDRGMRELLHELAPCLKQPGCELEFIVWTPTPAKSAWERSTRTASHLRQQSVQYLQLDTSSARQVTSSSKPWMYSNVQRPAMSVIVRKTK